MNQSASICEAVRAQVSQARTSILHSKDAENIERTLEQMYALLQGHCDGSLFTEKSNQAAAQQVFVSEYYSHWLSELFKCLSVEWVTLLSSQSKVLINNFFLHGPPTKAFMTLSEGVLSSRSGYQLNKCVSFLKELLRNGSLSKIMWEQCQLKCESLRCKRNHKKDCLDADKSYLCQKLTTQIISLPDRIAGRLHTETSEIFYPEVYITVVVKNLQKCLENIHDSIKSEIHCSLFFLNELLGRLCMTGYADAVWQELFPLILQQTRSNFVWCRVYECLVTGVPEFCLESVITPLLLIAPSHTIISHLLGHSALTSLKLQFILSNKLLLVRSFKQNRILHNIFGYLSSSTATKSLHRKAFEKLLHIWGDGSAIRHTSYYQHFYISRALVISVAFFNENQKKELKSEVIQNLMPGVQAHLASPIEQVRKLGMVVAEILTSVFDPAGEKLKFDYECDEEMKELKGLVVPPEEPDIETLLLKLKKPLMEENRETAPITVSKHKTVANVDHKETGADGEGSDLDSDDSLEPYDLSNDRKVSKVKPPTYLRDCMDGLLSSDDPDRVEACLEVAASLILKNQFSAKEVCVEFCKVLLHLGNNFLLPSFTSMRHKAMIALVTTCPEQVAAYLTVEFYEKNYNVRQRMDILEVLAAGAQQLSKPSEHLHEKEKVDFAGIQPATEEKHNTVSENWQQIVQDRIDRNTRRFAHGQQNPPPQMISSKFAPIAGNFFFPLIKYFDRAQNTIDLLGEDYLLLGRLLYTLGIVLYAAIHAPIVRQMAKMMMEFIWAVRYHQQPSVRQSVLFALCMVVLAVPPYMFMSDLQSDIIEAREWLHDVIRQDPDNQCQKLASQVLVLLENSVKQELEAK